MSHSGEYKKNEQPGEGFQRAKRDKPKQEPLAYPFRSNAKPMLDNKKKPDSSLGSDYSIIHTHPPMIKDEHHPGMRPVPGKEMKMHKNGGASRGMARGRGRGMGMNKKMKQRGHGSMQAQAYRGGNMRPPFGMPAIMTPPAPYNMPMHPMHIYQGQQSQSRPKHPMSSSPSLTFEQIMMMQPNGIELA